MIRFRTVALCAMTIVVLGLSAGCNEKCKHHQISTDDWSDRCLEYESSGRGASHPDEVETPPWASGGSLGRSAVVGRLDRPVGADVTLPRSTAPAGFHHTETPAGAGTDADPQRQSPALAGPGRSVLP